MKHKKVIIAVVICLLLILIPIYLNHPNRKYRRAVEAFNRDQTEEAATIFGEIPTYRDSAMYLSYLKSLDLYKKGDFENAEKGFRELGNFLNSPELVNHCVQEQQVQRYETALKTFENQSYAEAGELFRQLGSYERAKDYAAYCDGMVHFSEGEYRQAQEDFLQVSDFLDADSWAEASSMMEQETVYREARELFDNGKIQEARDLFQKIPDYEEATQYYRYTEGLLALEEKNYTVASTSFQSIPGFRDADDLARLSIERQTSQQYQDAVKLFKENRYKEATSAFASISSYADSEYYIDYMSAMEDLNSEKYPEAIEKLRRMETFLDSKRVADEAEKQYHTLLYNRAMTHFEDENYEEALELFEKLGEYKDSAQYRAYITGILADKKEDYLNAYTAYDSIPDFKDAAQRARAARNAYLEQQYQLGVAAVSDGDFGKALEAFEHTEGYKDTARYQAYISGRDALEHEDYRKAEATFGELGRFLDSRELMELSTEKLIPIRYDSAMEALEEGRYEEAVRDFEIIRGYRDADHYAEYSRVLLTAYVGDYQDAIEMAQKMEDFPDKNNLLIYIEARQAESELDYEKAIEKYQQIPTFRDSDERLMWLPDMILDRDFDRLADKLSARTWWNQPLMNEVSALLQKEYQLTNTTMKLRFLTLVDSLLENGDFEHSYQLTEQLVRQDEAMAPKLLDIQYLYALTEMEKNNPEQAEWMLEELAEQDYPEAKATLEQCWQMLREKAEKNGNPGLAEYYQGKLNPAGTEEPVSMEGTEPGTPAGPESIPEDAPREESEKAGWTPARIAFEEKKATCIRLIKQKLQSLVEAAEQMSLSSGPVSEETGKTEEGTENEASDPADREASELSDETITAKAQETDENPFMEATPDEAASIQDSLD